MFRRAKIKMKSFLADRFFHTESKINNFALKTHAFPEHTDFAVSIFDKNDLKFRAINPEKRKVETLMEQPVENSPNITLLLKEFSEGSDKAWDDLLPLIYNELHKQAARYLRRERQDHTLQTTALINEAYLKLVNQKEVKWQNRQHFYAIAAQAMRRILVDYAKTRNREKRGGDDVKLQLDDALEIPSEEKSIDLVALDEALTRLSKFDERQARIIELRYFSGLTEEETAHVLGVSVATVRLDWKMARAWLHEQLTK